MKCVNCKHLFDSGVEWYCYDNYGFKMIIPDPTEEISCEDYEEVE